MRVDNTDKGFFVKDGGVIVAGPFNTDAQAWREIDKILNEPMSKGQATSDWISNKILNAE